MHNIDQVLTERFGLQSFRDRQKSVIETVLEGRDSLLVMPTGGGKSLCFQLPAVCLPGVTLVVSPLIALMQDQVTALERRGIEATFVNSSLPDKEATRRIEGMISGAYKLVYVAPERFQNLNFVRALAACNVSLLVIDEAHCISQWGHDFRPDYRKLGEVRKNIGDPPVFAATATATPEVRKDIVKQLEMQNPVVTVTGFDRPNLTLVGRECASEIARATDFMRLVRSCLDEPLQNKTPVPPSLVYCTSRKECESVAWDLNLYAGRYDVKRLAEFYHADVPAEKRKATLDRFVSGETSWVVATIAFGMGVDKPDIRYVIHHTIPGSVEAYYQEVGRAGRDGKPSKCCLFYCGNDINTRRFFINKAAPDRSVGASVYSALRRLVGPGRTRRMTYEQIVLDTFGGGWERGLTRAQGETALTLIKHAGGFQAPQRGMVYMPTHLPKFDELKIDWDGLQDRRARELERLAVMQQLVVAKDKKEFILHYFGELA